MISDCPRLIAVVALAISVLTSASPAGSQTPEERLMVEFLESFVDQDYDHCRSLLAPSATISIVRRYQDGEYRSVHQDARLWLEEVGRTYMDASPESSQG